MSIRCFSNASFSITQGIDLKIHNHHKCRCQQYSIDFPRSKASSQVKSSKTVPRGKSLQYNHLPPEPAHPLIKDIPGRQFTIKYSAVCCSVEQNKDTNKHTRDPKRRQTKHCRSQHKTKGRLFQLIRIFHRKIGVSDNRNSHQSVKDSNLSQQSHFQMSQKIHNYESQMFRLVPHLWKETEIVNS